MDAGGRAASGTKAEESSGLCKPFPRRGNDNKFCQPQGIRLSYPAMRHFILLSLLFCLPGCSFFGGDKEDDTLNLSADGLYARAKGALDAGYYSEAIKHYQDLEARYPFGKHAQQALLDLAYAYYKSEEPEAAVAACDRFMRLYPQNPHVDYAYYLKGLTHFNRNKGFLQRYLPTDESERDTSAAELAFQDFLALTQRFPDSEYVADARQRMRYLRNNLARHELHVAGYYLRRGAFIAAANRARYVLENYPRTPSTPGALALMARAYRVLELDDLADDALRVLELNYPNHPDIYAARQRAR